MSVVASGQELLAAFLVLVGTASVGTVAHELTHALVLRTLDVPYDLEWLPGRDVPGTVRVASVGALATVTPRVGPGEASPTGLRVAALAPLVLATPAALVLAGVVPDPLAAGSPVAVAATIGWLACAIPSPGDFAVVWHAERALADTS